MIRSALVPIPFLAAAVLLAGCAGGSPAAAPTTSAPVASPSASAPPATPAPTGSADAPAPDPNDPDAPADQCADADLAVEVLPDEGGAGAGSIGYDVVFTNTGSASCELRGYPGVSVVGNGDGTQLGVPADRANAPIATVTLAPGAAATSVMQVVNLAGGGGALGCPTAAGDGWRVYPPHSFEAVFVADPDATACTDDQVFLHLVQPVTLAG